MAADELWRGVPGLEDHLVLGDSDLYLLTADRDGGAPVLRDRVTAEAVQRFPDVRRALERLLAGRR